MPNSAKVKQHSNIDMLNGPILPTMIRLAIPIVFSNLLAIILSAADMMVVGKFVSDSAFAAVSAATIPNSLLSAIIINLGIGADICCAHAFGSRDERRIEKAVHTAMTFSIVSGILMTVIRLALAYPMLKLINVPDSILGSTLLYMNITALSALPTCINQYATSLLRLNGDTKRPAAYMILAGFVNLLLNVIFVVGFDLGISGVAWATFISTLLSATLCVRDLMKYENASRLIIKKLRIDVKILKDILRLGIPAALRSFLYTMTYFFITSAMNSFNNELIISGHGAAGNIESIIQNILMSISSATIVIIGQNYGARNYKRIVKAQWYAIIAMLTSAALTVTVSLLFADTLLRMFITSPEAVSYGVIRLQIMAATTFLDFLAELFAGTMQSCKYSVPPTIISFLCTCVVRIVWVFTMFKMFPSYAMLIACYPVSNILSAVIMGIAAMIVLGKVKKKFAAESELSAV